ncbi:hypothetical protein scyTo_0015601, partial [Scyliorhinus torazame]|nr:hypothetical protein [Scyliorhinus torazame]
KQIHKAQNLLISKDALIFEGMRAEVKAAQGKICQDYFGCKIGLVKSSSALPVFCPLQSQTSLQLEIQDSQKAEETEGLPDPVCGLMPHKDQGDFFQEIFSHTKAKKHSTLFQSTVDEMVDQLTVQVEAFMASPQRMDTTQQLILKELKKELKQTMLGVIQKLHLLAPIKESWDKTMEGLELACAECQRQYINTKHNLANTIRELELQKVLREEAEEKAADARQGAEEATVKAMEAITARTLESRKVKKALEDMTAAEEEMTKARKVAMETEGKLLESNKKLVEVKEKLTLSELALLQLRQKVNEGDERVSKAKEKMAVTLEMTEERMKAFEIKIREMEKTIEETEQAVTEAEAKAATEEEKATRSLAQLERVQEEIEKVTEHTREILLESSKKVSVMEDSMDEMKEMMAAAQHKASSAQRRATMAEEKLLAILARAKRVENERDIAAGNTIEGMQNVMGRIKLEYKAGRLKMRS